MNQLKDRLLKAMLARAVALGRALSAFERPLGLALLTLVLLFAASSALAQTTALSYQGKLNDNGNPANGNYDFEFKLFDTQVSGTGTQQGVTVAVSNVTVTAGVFTLQLDFGAAVFTGAPRFLEIAVKKISDPTFTTLSPRQPVAANPYAIHTLNADGLSLACVSCITSSQIQSVQGSQVTGNIAGSQISGAIPVASVPAGSASYIQNSTSPQATSNFNISGNGIIGGNLNVGGALSLNIVNAQTQFNIAGSRVLSNAGTNNLFAGVGAGLSNTTGNNNAFFGTEAGGNNTTSSGNSFFGYRAGKANTTGAFNSFFGDEAGEFNTTGTLNAFFGSAAGFSNTTGSNNAFFGHSAGSSNTTGRDNAFFGWLAGFNNTTSGFNSFFGSSAGFNNTMGSANAYFGWGSGQLNTTGDNNAFFGFNAGSTNTTGSRNTFIGIATGFNNTTESDNTFIGASAHASEGVNHSTAIGADAHVDTSNTIKLGTGSDVVVIPSLGITFSERPLCRSPAAEIVNCSSSLRYKANVMSFTGGLEIINRLRPIRFTWKQGGMRDIGLGAEEVEKVEPLLTFRNDNGEIEGVKYDQLSAVFINAFKEQQAQIANQQQQFKQQQAQMKGQQREIETLTKRQQEFEALKKLVCADHPAAVACKSN